MLLVVKLVIIGVLLLLLAICKVLSVFSLQEVVGAIALGAIAYALLSGEEKDQEKKKITIVSDKKTEYNDVCEKADADYRFLQMSLLAIQDKELHYLLQSMQQIAERLLGYLEKHPERIPVASRFVNYYQDRTASLVRQYLSMREAGLRAELQHSLVQNMKNTFRGFLSAYESQLGKVMESELLDMEAEMKVAQQVMDEEGIRAKDTVYLPIEDEKEEKKSKKEQEDNNTPLKYAGIALAALIGAVGIYKLTDKKKEE